jgi:hypothetical protein
MRPLAVALGALALSVPAAHASDDPARQPPFGGQVPPPLVAPDSIRKVPPGHRLSASQAVAVAEQTDAVSDEREENPAIRPVAYLRGPDRWQVDYVAPGEERRVVALVVVDDRSGVVVEAWDDHQVATELARGYEGAIAQKVNAPYIWLPLCLLFILPFLDPRRPFRLLHLDLTMLLGLGVSLYFFNRAEITTSVPLTYPVLGYVFGRMLWEGLRPRAREGSLIPVVPVRWLAIAALILAASRIALNVADSEVIDVGAAGVIGADRIEHGEELYDGGFAPGIDIRGDVYGPVAYLAYVPFELAFPWDGVWDDLPAAHAAAIAFDLLAALGLFALGRRLRRDGDGTALGVALSFAWLAYPFTLYTMNANANDSLVAALTVGALLALSSAPVRGALVGLASAAKFGSAAIAPLFAFGTGERRLRDAVLFGAAFAVSALVLVLPFLPDGGLEELYDRTLGYQASRGSPFSVWGLAPSLEFARPLVRMGAVALAIGVAFHPRRKSTAQVAALAAAVTVAVQLGATHWFYFYVVWFLPLVLVAVFAAQAVSAPRSADARP